jgi:hypothetical protein
MYGAQASQSWDPCNQQVPWNGNQDNGGQVSQIDEIFVKDGLLMPDVNVPDIPLEWMEDWVNLDHLLGPEVLSILDHNASKTQQNGTQATNIFNSYSEMSDQPYAQSLEHSQLLGTTSHLSQIEPVIHTGNNFSPHTISDSSQSISETLSFSNCFNSGKNMSHFGPGPLHYSGISVVQEKPVAFPPISFVGTNSIAFPSVPHLDSSLPRLDASLPHLDASLTALDTVNTELPKCTQNSSTSFEEFVSDISRLNSVNSGFMSDDSFLDDVFTPATTNISPIKREMSTSSTTSVSSIGEELTVSIPPVSFVGTNSISFPSVPHLDASFPALENVHVDGLSKCPQNISTFDQFVSDISLSNSGFASDDSFFDDVFNPPSSNISPRKREMSSSSMSDDSFCSKRTKVNLQPVTPEVIRGKRLRKRVQNKTAATRYRMKKKSEAEGVTKEISDLLTTNHELRSNIEKIEEEIAYIKNFLKEIIMEKKSV